MVAAGLGIALAPPPGPHQPPQRRTAPAVRLPRTGPHPPHPPGPGHGRPATPPAQAMARVLRTVAQRFTAPGPLRAQLGAVRRG
jgi:hypothetical protein